MKGISTISSRKDFSLVFRLGNRSRHKGLQTIYISPKGGTQRLSEKENFYAFNFKRQFGNACRRNRMRRLFKEYLRLNSARFKTGYLIVFCLYKPCSYNSYAEVATMLDAALKKISIILDNNYQTIYPARTLVCQD